MFKIICNILTIVGLVCMIVSVVRAVVYFGVIGGTIVAVFTILGAIWGVVVYRLIKWIVSLIRGY